MRLVGVILGATLAGALVLSADADPVAIPPPAPTEAQAQPTPLTVTPIDPDMMARRMARRAARVDQDIQTLRAGLQLAPAQDVLWPPVAAAIHDVDTARGFRFRQTLAAAPSAVDGLKLQGDHMAAMGAALGKLAEATKPLVATLSADQKSRLPELLQQVRLPKAMSRALDLPQDSGGGWDGKPQGQMPQGRRGPGPRGDAGEGGAGDRAWGIGPQGPGSAGAPRRDAAPTSQGAGGAPAAATRAGAADEDGGDEE